MKHYTNFAGMILSSTIVMFILMFLNSYSIDHVFISDTRIYMAIMMGAAMTIIMLIFMLNMLKDRKLNIGIVIGSVLVFSLSLFLVRSQVTVQDTSYLKAMITHHSSAILTSERANLLDPRVRALADEIIEAQLSEIDEMKKLIEDIESKK